MKARRSYRSNKVFKLAGGTEDNDLWVELAIEPVQGASSESEETYGDVVLRSVWVPTDDERAAIAGGHNIELTTWGARTPPLLMRVTDVELGRDPLEPTSPPEGSCDWGGCDAPAGAWAWSSDTDMWLPVCGAHTRQAALEGHPIKDPGGYL